MTASRLAALLDQATEISDWHRRGADFCSQTSEIERHERYADAIEELAEAARLLVDMAAELRKHSSENEHDYISHPKADALLARFAGLNEKAGAA